MGDPRRWSVVSFAIHWRWLVGSLSLAFIVAVSVVPATRAIHTDFSNYYIPARLLVRGESVNRLYDMTWFQRQMVYAGIEEQAGGFNRFPPPAALVMLPLGGLPPLTAKRVWTAVNLAALLILLLLLGRLSGVPFSGGLFLAALSGLALRNNFLFGQFYILLALSIAAALFLRQKGHSTMAGVLLGMATAIKLYPAPFLMYFLLRRDWRAASGFLLGLGGMLALSVAALGWEHHVFFFTVVLPRSLAGLTDNPFHPGLQSATSLLRRLFVAEPTLNPEPWLSWPLAFHFLRSVFLLGTMTLLLTRLRRRDDAAHVSLFVLALLVVSPVILSYHVVLALIPVLIWVPRSWREGHRWPALAVLSFYVLACSPAVYVWPEAYLRFWALLGLLLLLLFQWQRFAIQWPAMAAVAMASIFFSLIALRPMAPDGAVPVAWTAARNETPTQGEGLVYAALYRDRYRLDGQVPNEIGGEGHFLAPRWTRDQSALFFERTVAGDSRVFQWRDGELSPWTPSALGCTSPSVSRKGDRLATLCKDGILIFDGPGSQLGVSAKGEVADPALSPDGSRLAFAENGRAGWRLFEMDLERGTTRELTSGSGTEREPSFSPDGRFLAFTRRVESSWHLWLLDFDTGLEKQLTWQPGNDRQPAWSPDGKHVYFASDRGRGIFMPAIYRLELLPG